MEKRQPSLRLRWLAILGSLLLIVAACATEEVVDTTPPPDDAPDVTPDVTPAPEPEEPIAERDPVTIEVISPGFATPALEEYVVPYMLENYNVTVAMQPMLSSEALATATAQRGNPAISVIMMDTGPWLLAKDQGLWGEIDPDLVPNLAQIPEQYVDPDLQGVSYSSFVLGFIYNAEQLEAAGVDPPASYADLADEVWRDRISIQLFTSTFAYALLWQLQRTGGGDPTDPTLEVGFERIADIVPNIRELHGGTSTLIDLLLADQDVWVAHSASSVPQRLKAEGQPFEWVEPEEGAALIPVSIAVVDNAPHYEEAMLFINTVLSAEFGPVFAREAGTLLHNPNAVDLFPADLAAEFFVTSEVLDRAPLIPFDILNEHRVELNERYQREVEAAVGS